jgi:hypothetical protein
MLRALERGEPVTGLVAPPEAIAYARGYVRRKLPVGVLLRGYRVGQAYLLDLWSAAMSDLLGEGPEVGEALLAGTAWVFAYVDRICNQLVVEYASAQREWADTSC